MKARAAKRTPGQDKLELVIPGIPPSVNHYVKHTRAGRHFMTAQAKRFKESVAAIAAGRWVEAEHYFVRIVIFLGKGQRGDIDNFCKVVLDALVDCGAIHSDSAVTDMTLHKNRSEQPCTEIFVSSIV